jgi:hypothetical protein
LPRRERYKLTQPTQWRCSGGYMGGNMLQLSALALLLGCSEPTVPLSYQVVDIESMRFVAAVTESSPGSRELRYLNIICESGCPGRVEFMEEVGDTPLGLFRTSDIDDNLISTWVAGTSYVVRVYHLSNSSITKVLDEHSVRAPEIGLSGRGTTRIVVFARSSPHAQTTPHILDWDGQRFVRN